MSDVEASSPPRRRRAGPVEVRDDRPQRLTRVMIAGYLPFVLGLCLITGLIGSWLLATGFLIALPFGLLLLATVAHVLWGLRVLFAGVDDHTDPMAFDLPDDWQAGLRSLVDGVARDRGLPSPHIIRIHATDVAHVYEGEAGLRVLAIGGMTIAALPQSALAGIVAHELAHFGAGDTTDARRAGRWHRVMGQLEDQFLAHSWYAWNPLAWLVRGYHRAYFAAQSAASRDREYAADQFEVAHVGKREAAAALVLIEVLNALAWTNLFSVAESAVRLQTPIERIFAEQVRLLRAAGPSEWDDGLKKALRRPTGWFDSHPNLRDRLKAIGVKPVKALALATDLTGQPATDLFANWPVVEEYITKRIMSLVREVTAARLEYAADIAAIAGAITRQSSR